MSLVDIVYEKKEKIKTHFYQIIIEFFPIFTVLNSELQTNFHLEANHSSN